MSPGDKKSFDNTLRADQTLINRTLPRLLEASYPQSPDILRLLSEIEKYATQMAQTAREYRSRLD